MVCGQVDGIRDLLVYTLSQAQIRACSIPCILRNNTKMCLTWSTLQVIYFYMYMKNKGGDTYDN